MKRIFIKHNVLEANDFIDWEIPGHCATSTQLCVDTEDKINISAKNTKKRNGRNLKFKYAFSALMKFFRLKENMNRTQ